MSFKGRVQARCPRGCEPVDVEIWTFVRGDRDEGLREALLGGEFNLLSCEECGELFYPEACVIYYDAAAELLAFVFPESHRAEEAKWREKMGRDFLQMRRTLAGETPLRAEPLLFFGMDALRGLLEAEAALADEVRVAEHLCGELGLAPLRVDRAFARAKGLAWILPSFGKKGVFSRDAILKGLRALLAANDRLAGYRSWEELLKDESFSVTLRERPAG